MEIDFTFQIITILVIIGHIQSGIENLLLAIKNPLIFNFSLAQYGLTSRYIKWSKFAFDTPGIWILSGLKLILGIFVIYQAVIGQINPYLVCLIVLIDLLTFPRLSYLIVSESPMQRVIFIAIITHSFFNDSSISVLALYFISAQIILSYFSAGWQKIIDRSWRTGQSMTHFIGDFLRLKNLSKFLINRKLNKWLSWSVIFFECFFFLSLSGGWVTYLFLMIGFSFHFLLLIRRSLNFFFWTFISAYPAIYFTSEKVVEFLYR
jgi:hypothetical protein